MAIEKERALKYLARIPYIDHGGCGISAYVFYLNEKLAGRGKNLQIACIGSIDEYGKTCRGFYNNARAIEKERLELADACSHFAWTYNSGKTLYDCKGKLTLQETDRVLLVPVHMTEEFLVNALNAGNWNWKFDKEKYVPRVGKFFGQNFSNLEEYLDIW